MSPLWTGVLVLSFNFAPCSGVDFKEPIACYFLDGILMVYCLVVTAFFVKERFCNLTTPQETEGIYQELKRQEDVDPYQVLQPTKPKERDPKKKRRVAAAAHNRDADPYESLPVTASAPATP